MIESRNNLDRRGDSRIAPTNPILHTNALSIGYKQGRKAPVVVAEDIEVSLYPGELVCLIGPNGVGKSTLMRTLAGMQLPLSGGVTLDGEEVHNLHNMDLARLLSVVLTERVDVGTLSVYALVGLGRYPYTDWSGVLSEDDEKVVRWAVESVGAVDLAHRNVGELSDGERQKVMIARALAQEPAVMLLDEPTAFLDLPRRVEIMQMLRQLVRDTGRTVLLSTHDLDLALRTADRIWLMPHDAPMQVGAPEDLVLNGAFETAFHSEGVIFDPETGSFRIHQKIGNGVALSGDEGIAMIWTRRALEREGFAIVPVDQSNLRLEVIQGEDGPSWCLSVDETQTQDTSLYAVIATLRAALDQS